MTPECIVCGHPRWRSEHADWCKRVGLILSPPRVRLPCSVDDCDRLSHARGWCQWHYNRWRRHGTPSAAVSSPIPARVARSAHDETAAVIEHNDRVQPPAVVPMARPVSSTSAVAGRVVLVLNSKRAGACNASSSTRAS